MSIIVHAYLYGRNAPLFLFYLQIFYVRVTWSEFPGLLLSPKACVYPLDTSRRYDQLNILKVMERNVLNV